MEQRTAKKGLRDIGWGIPLCGQSPMPSFCFLPRDGLMGA